MQISEWTSFVAAFAVFFVSHVLFVRPPLKPVLVRYLGSTVYTLAYSLLSIFILLWLIKASASAPYVELWPFEAWHRHLLLTIMLPVCMIAAFGVARPNPFSFGGARNDLFDPQRAGILKWMRHPLLVAAFVWSFAHMLANGNLAHVLLFGSFALFSILGMKLIDLRKQREMGETWFTLQHQSRASSYKEMGGFKDVGLRLFGGLVFYVGLLVLHPWFAGVNPIAG